MTRRSVEVQELDDSLLEKYVGGAGLGARLLYDETTPTTDPLGPENILAAMTGPFTDSRVPSSSRHHVMARSPLTGLLGESNVGGSWAVHFKKTGYDGIVVTGKADTPVYLWIHDGGVEIRDARPIMGKDSLESAEWLKGQTTDKASAAVIGPAGERMVRIAGIPHVGTIVRQAARCGLGAVMGSKNLKAMVAYGTKKAGQAREEELKEAMKTVLPHVRKATETFGKYGTSGGRGKLRKNREFPPPELAGEPLGRRGQDLRGHDARHDPEGENGMPAVPDRLRPPYLDRGRAVRPPGGRRSRIRDHRHHGRRMPGR